MKISQKTSIAGLHMDFLQGLAHNYNDIRQAGVGSLRGRVSHLNKSLVTVLIPQI